MTTTQSHSTRSRYSLACTYSCLNPIAVRSPEQTTMSGCWSLISLIARSISPGTKWTSPQWMSEMWAIFIAGKFRAGLEDPLHRPVERPRDERRRRDRQHPREDDVAGDAPPHRREALRRPRPHHRPRDDMSRRDRIPEMRGEVKHRAPGDLGSKTARRLHREDPLSDRAHDPPAADVRSSADREAGRDDHPRRNVEVVDLVSLEESERDHAHRLLRVVGTVCERNPRPRG